MVGQVVTAISSSGVVYTAITDANGLYIITVPANDTYTVTTGTPAGTVPSTVITTVADDANAVANNDKNHDNTGTRVTVVTTDNLSVDFGFNQPATPTPTATPTHTPTVTPTATPTNTPEPIPTLPTPVSYSLGNRLWIDNGRAMHLTGTMASTIRVNYLFRQVCSWNCWTVAATRCWSMVNR